MKNILEKEVKETAKEIEGIFSATGKAIPRNEVISILQLIELRKLNRYFSAKDERELQKKKEFMKSFSR